jgi:hypothetical protein
MAERKIKNSFASFWYETKGFVVYNEYAMVFKSRNSCLDCFPVALTLQVWAGILCNFMYQCGVMVKVLNSNQNIMGLIPPKLFPSVLSKTPIQEYY